MSIRSQLLIGIFMIILIFGVTFFVNQRLSQEVLTNTTYLNNSEAVIRNSNALHKEMIEMQSGFRGFLLTRHEIFLQPYYEGLQSVPVYMRLQRELLSTQTQKEKLDTISILHKEWVEYANSLISARKDTLPESDRKYRNLLDGKLKMEVGKKLNDQIKIVFASLDGHEYRLRTERRAKLQRSIRETRELSVLLTIICIIVSVGLGVYFLRTISGRISKMVRFAHQISEGEFISIKDKKKDEFSWLIKSLNKMSETLNANFKELRMKNKELDQFAYVVSHDLKAPLRGISNIISWIEEDSEHELTPEVRNNLVLIKGRTDRLENMINGLLEYARVGKIKKGLEKVDVNKMLVEIKELIVPPGVSLIIKQDLPTVYTERLYLEQVFSNLISNAVKHNNAGEPKVIIEGSDKGTYYEFRVSDNGPGIEEQYFEKIFVIFQTLQERDAFESTGVGLAIVKKIIDDHKGTIHVESEPGEGSTFVFTWPKVQPTKKDEKNNTTN